MMKATEVVAYGGPRDGATYRVPQSVLDAPLGPATRLFFHADPPPEGPLNERGEPTVVYHSYRLVWPDAHAPTFWYDGEVLLTAAEAATLSSGCPDDH